MRAPADGDVVWKPAQMMKIGRTVLAIEEPLAEALASIEAVADEALSPEEAGAPPSEPRAAEGTSFQPADVAPSGALAAAPAAGVKTEGRRAGWSAADMLVMAAALAILALSLAGLVWLLRGR